MTKKSNGSSLSRREFMKGFGTGVIGSSLFLGRVGEAVAAESEEVKAFLSSAEPLTFTLNGEEIRVMVEPRTTLAELLRNHLNLTGTKIVCGRGECGGCTVLLNGKAIYSCHTLALDVAGLEVLTIEGLLSGEQLHPVQEAFVEEDGLQCGFCTPGQILAAYALLESHPKPSDKQIQYEMAGNLCRCAAYPNIIRSVRKASTKMNGGIPSE